MISYKDLFSRWHNISDLLILSIALGVSWTYIAVISVLLTPFNYSQVTVPNVNNLAINWPYWTMGQLKWNYGWNICFPLYRSSNIVRGTPKL